MVAGATHGVAKAADVVPVKVLDCGGKGSLSVLLAGINWVLQDHGSGPAVANMSLGGRSSESLDEAVQAMVADGITVVVAAGNAGADACGSSPARVPEAVTVGASTRTDAVASFSNGGSCTDIFAPGVEVGSAWKGSNHAYRCLAGTSAAAPHVAGAAALILGAVPTAHPADVWARIQAESTTGVLAMTSVGGPNRLVHVGSGAARSTGLQTGSAVAGAAIGGCGTCAGTPATVVGYAGADTIRGTKGRDVIVARAGNDTIRGLGGNDLICAGRGSDNVRGGAGADVVYGQSGGDVLLGGGAADRLLGSRGPDDLVGGPGNDRIHGHRGRDLLLGRGGDDRLLGGAHRDVCRGAGGRDRAAACEVRSGVP